MKRSIIALACCAGGLASAGHAQDVEDYYKGDRLWTLCGSSVAGAPPTSCQTYVAGVIDAFAVARAAQHQPPAFCLGSVPLEQATNAVRRRLQQHPEERQYVAAALVITAVSEAFPCR